LAPMETKGSDSGLSQVPGLDLFQWKYWGLILSADRRQFTPVHRRPPTPPFPVELVSRMPNLPNALIPNKLQPGLDPKAYPSKTGYRERALLTYVT
jgi:hypothetical protein